MTERGVPLSDAAPACPFVAFDDERDDRSNRPDPRHRCYAESPPAPRSRSHQEQFCLAPGFAACPVFLSWARRESARVVPAPSPEAAPRLRPSGPVEPERGAVPSSGEPGRRSAAMPGQAQGAGTGGPAAAGSAARSSATPGASAGGRDAADEENLAALLGPASAASGPEPPAGSDDEDAWGADLAPSRPPQPAWTSPPAWLVDAQQGGAAGPDASADQRRYAPPPNRGRPPDPSRGLADSEAARQALDEAPEPPEPEPRAVPVTRSRAGGPVDAPVEDEWQDFASEVREPQSAGFGADDAPGGRGGGLASMIGWDRRPRAGSGGRLETRDQPSWERPRRHEAYPTLKSRTGLGSPSRVALGALALIGAALVLFFVPPILLRSGGTPGTTPRTSANANASVAPGSSPSASAVGSAVASLAPTPIPKPTPLTYHVKSGDTLSRIAQQYGVTVDQILAANKNIKDPNKIGIGDVIIIPVPVPTAITDGAAASP